MKSAARCSAGFTTIELVAVIIVLGILGAFTLPHFLRRDAFDARGVHDSLVSALRYAQKTALASNCPVRVQIQTNGYSLTQQPSPCGGAAAFSEPVVNPADGAAFAFTGPGNVALTNATVTFAATGAATSGCGTPISVTGAGRTRSLTVVCATGYVKTQ